MRNCTSNVPIHFFTSSFHAIRAYTWPAIIITYVIMRSCASLTLSLRRLEAQWWQNQPSPPALRQTCIPCPLDTSRRHIEQPSQPSGGGLPEDAFLQTVPDLSLPPPPLAQNVSCESLCSRILNPAAIAESQLCLPYKGAMSSATLATVFAPIHFDGPPPCNTTRLCAVTA